MVVIANEHMRVTKNPRFIQLGSLNSDSEVGVLLNLFVCICINANSSFSIP